MKKIIVLALLMILIGTITTVVIATNNNDVFNPPPVMTFPAKGFSIYTPPSMFKLYTPPPLYREIYYPPHLRWPWPPPQVVKLPPLPVINWTMPIMKPVPPIVIRPMPIFGGSVQQSFVSSPTYQSPIISDPIKIPITDPIKTPIVIPLPPIIWSGTGEIKYLDFEGGFYGIVSNDGEHYNPINLPSEYNEDGLQVNFKFIVLENQINYHMWGTPIKIIEISAIT